MASLCSYIFCCNKPPPYRRDIKLACFGIDGAGKTFVLKLLKGEDPRKTLTTNGFSVLGMEYDEQFHLTVYDVGGAKTIRDIWPNYYGEVHGILFVADVSNEECYQESVEAIQQMMRHPHSGKKPILVVLNGKSSGVADEVEFANKARLQEIADQQQQMVHITHLSEYKGHLDNVAKSTMSVKQRCNKDKTAMHEQFCLFIDLIIQHYVYLSEAVKSAELALKIRQQTDRENRRIKLMKEEHDKRAADIAGLEGRALPPRPPIQEEDQISPSSSLQSSSLDDDMVVSPPLESQLSQTSTKPVSPEDELPQVDEKLQIVQEITKDVFIPPKTQIIQLEPKKDGRFNSRITRIQSTLSNRVVPA